MRPRILSRYILRLYLSNLVLGLGVFTFVLILDKLFELVDLLVNKGAGLFLTGKMLLLLLPTSLSLTLPISNLLAALLTYGQLSETNEITAARASGIATWDLGWAPVIIAVLSVLFLLPFNSRWAPHAQTKFRQIYVQLLERNPLVRIEEKTFSDVGDYHMYVEKKTWRNPPLRGVTIYKTPPGGAPLRIFADRGSAHVNPAQGMWLVLEDGHMQEINPAQPEKWFYTTFKTYEFFIPFEGQKKTSTRAIQEMDNKELRREAAAMRDKGFATPIYSSEIHLRLALAATPLLFVLLGIPLALRVRRGGRSIGFGLSLGILVAYYILIMSGISVAQRGTVPAGLAVWFANGILMVAGAGLCWKSARE